MTQGKTNAEDFFLKQRGSSKGCKRNTTNRHERERPHLKTAAEVSHAVRQQVNTAVYYAPFCDIADTLIRLLKEQSCGAVIASSTSGSLIV